jgi:hypothetical protein
LKIIQKKSGGGLREIPRDWGMQRIKGLSVALLIKHFFENTLWKRNASYKKETKESIWNVNAEKNIKKKETRCQCKYLGDFHHEEKEEEYTILFSNCTCL